MVVIVLEINVQTITIWWLSFPYLYQPGAVLRICCSQFTPQDWRYTCSRNSKYVGT